MAEQDMGLLDEVDDNLADLAAVFGGGIEVWMDLDLWELAKWRKRAVDRHNEGA